MTSMWGVFKEQRETLLKYYKWCCDLYSTRKQAKIEIHSVVRRQIAVRKPKVKNRMQAVQNCNETSHEATAKPCVFIQTWENEISEGTSGWSISWGFCTQYAPK
jgi:hypothetical protein